MGGVPVLLVTMLLGMSGTPFHHGVSFFHGVDLETGFIDTGVVQRDVTSKLNSHGSADCPLGDELGTAVQLVSDTSVCESGKSVSGLQKQDLASAGVATTVPVLTRNSSDFALQSALNSRKITMRKPQNTGATTNSGFSLPTVPPSLAEAGRTVAPNVDRAGRPISPAAAAQGATNGTTFPSTAESSAFETPPFTGTANAVVASGAAGQTTMPGETNTRATAWGQFPLPTTTPTASGSSFNAASNENVTAEARATSASPLLPTDTFGRTPESLSVDSNGGTMRSSALPGLQTTGRNNPVASSGDKPGENGFFADNRAANNAATGSFGANLVNRTPTNPVANNRSQPTAGTGQPLNDLPVGQPPLGRFGPNPSASFTAVSPDGASADTAAARIDSIPRASTHGFSVPHPDARLSAAQVAAGAWSVDAFGYPVDRTGQRIASATETATDHRRINETGRASFHADAVNQTASHANAVYPRSAQNSVAMNASSSIRRPDVSSNSHSAASSLTEETQRPVSNASAGSINKPSEPSFAQSGSTTTQPLFNGILLISLVVNVYLVFWLKNLRLQYQEMVAAKRMANSNASST